MIPVGEDVASFSVDDDVSWVLIVEKEVTKNLNISSELVVTLNCQAVFQTLCRLGLTRHPSLPGRGLIITVCSQHFISAFVSSYVWHAGKRLP